jgi:hypothetical protein
VSATTPAQKIGKSAAEIEKGAQQKQEGADARHPTQRCPYVANVLHWPRIAHNERVGRFTVGPQIFH